MNRVIRTLEEFEKFKTLYTTAKNDDETTFWWRDIEVHVEFAKYVIEFYEDQFDRIKQSENESGTDNN